MGIIVLLPGAPEPTGVPSALRHTDLFDPAVDELLDGLPSWWRHRDPDSLLHLLLTVIGRQVDGLADTTSQLANNASLVTADLATLQTEYAVLAGVENEQAPTTLEQLRSYILARMAEDGTVASLTRTLVALIALPVNIDGTEWTFPANGSGLTFPTNGSGIFPLFQRTPVQPDLHFAVNGTGLQFPAVLSFPRDGTGLELPLTLDPSFEAITFGDGTGWFVITENPDGDINQIRLFPPNDPLVFPASGGITLFDHDGDPSNPLTFTVTTKSYLAFDRGAVLRAIDRFRLAHLLPAIYAETNY